jgi:hypothetical protein
MLEAEFNLNKFESTSHHESVLCKSLLYKNRIFFLIIVFLMNIILSFAQYRNKDSQLSVSKIT